MLFYFNFSISPTAEARNGLTKSIAEEDIDDTPPPVPPHGIAPRPVALRVPEIRVEPTPRNVRPVSLDSDIPPPVPPHGIPEIRVEPVPRPVRPTTLNLSPPSHPFPPLLHPQHPHPHKARGTADAG